MNNHLYFVLKSHTQCQCYWQVHTYSSLFPERSIAYLWSWRSTWSIHPEFPDLLYSVHPYMSQLHGITSAGSSYPEETERNTMTVIVLTFQSPTDWLNTTFFLAFQSIRTYIIEFRPWTDKRGTKPPTTIWPNPWRHRNLWPQSWYKVGRKVSEVARLLKTTVNSDEIQKNYSSKIGLLKSV